MQLDLPALWGSGEAAVSEVAEGEPTQTLSPPSLPAQGSSSRCVLSSSPSGCAEEPSKGPAWGQAGGRGSVRSRDGKSIGAEQVKDGGWSQEKLGAKSMFSEIGI